MNKRLWILAVVLLMAGTAFAQAEKDGATAFYHLDFVTKEMDDNKLVNARTYSMIISEKSVGNIRTGTRVPVPTNANGGQVTYLDLGVNIDCSHVQEVSGQLTLSVSADIATAVTETGGAPALAPVIRQYKWNSSVIVPLRKATQIYSSDDLGSKRKFQLELTATPIK
jgi:hypothetical protein